MSEGAHIEKWMWSGYFEIFEAHYLGEGSVLEGQN
jgi:hypothetical protein